MANRGIKVYTSQIAEEIKQLLVTNELVDRAWIGMPKKIPSSAKTIAIIEPINDPEYHYTATKNKVVFKFTDFYITILTKGKDETAFKNNWDSTDKIKRILTINHKLNGKCIDSTLEDTLYGTPNRDETNKGLTAGSQITLRCKNEV